MATSTVQNDTYGEISREELSNLRAVAQTCSTCGMLGTVDPNFHAARYGHNPTINDSGKTYEWNHIRFGWDAQ